MFEENNNRLQQKWGTSVSLTQIMGSLEGNVSIENIVCF